MSFIVEEGQGAVRPRRKKKGSKDATLNTDDPPTMMSEGGAPLPDTGGKKKKKKLTAAEKNKIKLDKDSEKLRVSGEPFDEYVARMDKWMLANYPRAFVIYRKVDEDVEGILSYDDFKSAMFDLEAPCTEVELHLLCKLLDPEDTEEIEYGDVRYGMRCVRQAQEAFRMEDIKPPLIKTAPIKDMASCATCSLKLWDGDRQKDEYPRYIKAILRLATFEDFKQHPGHFDIIVHSHIKVAGLVRLIQEHTQMVTTQMAIFTDRRRTPESMLHSDLSLEENGIQGGPITLPEEVLMFYDYKTEFNECPLLMADHYFGQKLRIN